MQPREALKQLLWRSAPTVYRRARGLPRQEFSIGILAGPSPFELRPLPSVANPVLMRDHVTDVPAMMVADPFMCRRGERWYMFFEVIDHVTRKGKIGLAVSRDALHWEYQRIVLSEPFHLSYPCVFEWQSEYFMIPESSHDGTVRLYRATDFPERWAHVATLLEGGRYVDSSILHHDDHWWLLTEAGEDAGHPLLRLFHARELFGPWREHPSSPIVSGNLHIARPGGSVILVDGMPVRFAQDLYPTYGSKVHAFAITKLTPTEYEERPAAQREVLAAGSEEWNRDGMHHVDAHRQPDGTWIACVDGCRFNGPRH